MPELPFTDDWGWGEDLDVLRWDERQVQFGDETMKYLPPWATVKQRGFVEPRNAEEWEEPLQLM